MKKLLGMTKIGLVLTFGLASGALAQDFCSNAQHSGQSVKISSNQTGKIGNIGYELWDENGHGGDATFYSDGSMECNITGAKDYLCRAGLSLGSNKTYKELGGDMIAEFKLVKSNAQNVGYSYIGIYGWMEGVPGTASNLVEYYVIDNTLANDMPGSWIGNERKGTITVDGGTYTVYRNTRTGPAIKNSGNVTFYQYFSVRTSPRDCGTINISEHMRQWEKMGLTMGKLYEAKVLGEAGNVNGEVRSGHMDFPHAKVYVSDGSSSGDTPKSSSSGATAKSSSSKGSTAVSGTIDACKDEMGHQGESKTTQGQNNSSVTGNVGSSPYHYEIWYQGGNNSMTFYDNGTYKASWNGTNDFLARVGFKYNEDKTYDELGPIDAYYKWSKQGNAGGYNYIGIYGWTVNPLVEYYIVDDWFNKPGANLTGQKKGEFEVDGDVYEVYQNQRYNAPSIKGNSDNFPQYFSVRKSGRSCGHIDVTAHFKKWEALGMKMGKMYEAKVLVEAGGGSGSFDVTYFKMTDKAHPLPQPEPESSSSEAEAESSSSGTVSLHEAPKMQFKSGNFQVFDMQGRYLGSMKVEAGATVNEVLKANFKSAGIYMVKQGSFMQRFSVK